MRQFYDIKTEVPDEKERQQIYQRNLITDGEEKHVVPIEKLFEWVDNPKSASVEDMNRLEAQIKRLGQYKPLVIEMSGQVLGGNHRLKKYRAMGLTHAVVTVVYPEDEDQRVEYALSDNDHIAEYEAERLAEKLKALQKIDLNMYKVSLGPLNTLAEVIDKYTESPPEDDVPDLPATAVSTIGEVYQLGRHRLVCGDATVAGYYKALMGDAQADMVFTDPPYNIDIQGRTKDKLKIKNDSMSDDQFTALLRDSLTLMMQHTAGTFYVCMSHRELHRLKPIFEQSGGHFDTFLIWVKNNFVLSGSDWHNQFEPILYGWRNGSDHYFAGFRDEGNVWTNLEILKAKVDDDGDTVIKLGLFTLKLKGKVEGKVMRKRDTVDIWEEKRPAKSEQHPTMKPIKLVSKAIRASSQRGQVVLDPFGGSGSTLIAAERTGRTCYMMELDPKYIDVILQRYENVTGEKPQRIGKVRI